MQLALIREDAFSTTGNWTPEQLKLAFHFYCQTPFGKLHAKNPDIIRLAALIGRTPSALAMKLSNFASLDPAITSSGRKGLSGASTLDRNIWNEFHANWDQLVDECNSLHAFLTKEKGDVLDNRRKETESAEQNFSGETRLALIKQRLKQDFFRRAVLSSYGEKCCISGLSDKRFLVASHIVAWSEDASIRLHPGNGLCLSAIHDKAFDNHLFSLTDDHRVLLSKQLERTNDTFLREIFWPIQDRPIHMPTRFQPLLTFVQRHREHMFTSDVT